jgi:tetratricopeptide (TPR) repeat protein
MQKLLNTLIKIFTISILLTINILYGQDKQNTNRNTLSAEEYFNIAFKASDNQNYQKAIQDYNKAIEINPNNGNIYYNKGAAHNNLKEYIKAISSYDKTIEINPNDSEAYNNRGFSYYLLNKYEKACKDFKIAIKLGNTQFYDFLNEEELCN